MDRATRAEEKANKGAQPVYETEGDLESSLRQLQLYDIGLKEALQNALLAVTNGVKPKDFFSALPCTGPKQSVCNVSWKRGSIAYRCLVCEVDPTSAVCRDCFRGGDHAGCGASSALLALLYLRRAALPAKLYFSSPS
eukprot:5713585-Pleurochrysis_carterae.AAC.1